LDDRDDPDERDMRRRHLAKRLVSHRARTQTIYEFTGFTRHRLENLRRRWGVLAEERHRGPSPSSFAEFFRTSKSLQAATAAAVLCDLLGVLRHLNAGAKRGVMTLELGEQLCYAYEALQAAFPHLNIEFEHLVLLACGLAEGTMLQLGHCTACGAALLIDKLEVRPAICRPSCHAL
jgi:hypothetical protein